MPGSQNIQMQKGIEVKTICGALPSVAQNRRHKCLTFCIKEHRKQYSEDKPNNNFYLKIMQIRDVRDGEGNVHKKPTF